MTLILIVLLDGGGSGVYSQQHLGDNWVDIEQGVQVKTQELFTRPGNQQTRQGLKERWKIKAKQCRVVL